MPEVKYTPEQLDTAIDDFIDQVEAGTIKRPSDYALAKYLNVSITTLNRYYTAAGHIDEDTNNNSLSDTTNREIVKYRGYGKAIKKLVAYREDRLQGIAEDNPKLTGYAAFILKQPHSGGYRDKQEQAVTGDIAVKINLQSADGKLYNNAMKTAANKPKTAKKGDE